MRFNNYFILFLLVITCQGIFGQIVESTSFEEFADKTNFTKSSWQTAGFSVPWVNGFDQNRGMVDDSYAVTGSKSLRLFYPKGQFGTSNSGGQASLTVAPRDEYFISYYVRFSDDFSWGNTSEGGKLPGLAGGARCSGCATCTGTNGFTARLMWRQGGKAVVYLYHLNKQQPPCGDNYEIFVDGKNFNFQKGKWHKVSQRVKVNTGTNKNGEVEMWIDDKQTQLKLYDGTFVDKLTSIQFVNNGDKVDALYFSTFHGGSNSGWAPTVDSYIWFDDVVISSRQSDVLYKITSLEENSTLNDQNFSPSPNPIKVGQNVKLSNHTNNNALIWLNSIGEEVAQTIIFDQNYSQAPNLPSGLYYIKFDSHNNQVVKKIIIE